MNLELRYIRSRLLKELKRVQRQAKTAKRLGVQYRSQGKANGIRMAIRLIDNSDNRGAVTYDGPDVQATEGSVAFSRR